MRKKRFFKAAIHEHFDRIYSPSSHPEGFSDWLQRIRGGRPLTLEIGMGTGDYLACQALAHPERFFLGVETKADRVYHAHQKMTGLGVNNLAFLQCAVERVHEGLAGIVEELVIFFPDPWPKKDHCLRRLTSSIFLPLYEDFLTRDGQLMFKTDDEALFRFSEGSFRDQGWTILKSDEDYVTPEPEQTAYEKRFRKIGKPIFFIHSTPPPGR